MTEYISLKLAIFGEGIKILIKTKQTTSWNNNGVILLSSLTNAASLQNVRRIYKGGIQQEKFFH